MMGFFNSTKEVMFSPLVYLSFLIGLFVCEQDYAKTTKQISTKFGGRM